MGSSAKPRPFPRLDCVISGKKDLRSCQECLKSVKAVREHLQGVKSRLWRVEMKLGIQVPPQELDLDEEEEESEGRQTPPCLSPEEEAQENT